MLVILSAKFYKSKHYSEIILKFLISESRFFNKKFYSLTRILFLIPERYKFFNLLQIFSYFI